METSFQVIVAFLTIVISLITIVDRIPDLFRKFTKKGGPKTDQEDHPLIRVSARTQGVLALMFVLMSSFLSIAVVNSSLKEREYLARISIYESRTRETEDIIRELRAQNARIIRNSLK